MRRGKQGTTDIKWQQIGTEVPSSGNRFSRWLGRILLNGLGWKLLGELPNRPRFIIAIAPHTSNVDFVLTMGVILSLGIKTSYLAKRSLFRFPVGIVIKWFGGIPVDRGSNSGLVEQMAARFEATPKMILGIAPQGTRSATGEWRRGFVMIAQAANVPIQPAVINYKTKEVTFTPLIENVDNPDQTLSAVKQAATAGYGRR